MKIINIKNSWCEWKYICTVLKLRVRQVIYESEIYMRSILLENSAEDLGSRRECCGRCAVSVFENTPTNSVVQRRVQLDHSSHIIKAGVEATCWHFNPWCILKETNKPATGTKLWPNYATGTLTSWKGC